MAPSELGSFPRKCAPAPGRQCFGGLSGLGGMAGINLRLREDTDNFYTSTHGNFNFNRQTIRKLENGRNSNTARTFISLLNRFSRKRSLDSPRRSQSTAHGASSDTLLRVHIFQPYKIQILQNGLSHCPYHCFSGTTMPITTHITTHLE